MQKTIFAACLGAALAAASLSAAADDSKLSVGFAAYVDLPAYKDYDPAWYPLPIIQYESDRFYFKGIEGGMYLLKSQNHEITLGLGWIPAYFKASKSDDHQVRHLDDRETSLALTAGYAFKTEHLGRFDLTFAGDMLSKSNGFVAGAAYSYPFAITPSTMLVPSASITYMSEKVADYYFGVSAHEARRTGLERYVPDAGFVPALSLTARHQINERWSVYGTTGVKFLPNEVKDSPMTEDDSTQWTFGVGVAYAL